MKILRPGTIINVTGDSTDYKIVRVHHWYEAQSLDGGPREDFNVGMVIKKPTSTIRNVVLWVLSQASPNTAIAYSDIVKACRKAGYLNGFFTGNSSTTMHLDRVLKRMVSDCVILKPVRGKYCLNPKVNLNIDSQFPQRT